MMNKTDQCNSVLPSVDLDQQPKLLVLSRYYEYTVTKVKTVMWEVSIKSMSTEIHVGLFLVGQFHNTGLFTSFSADQVNGVKIYTGWFLFFT